MNYRRFRQNYFMAVQKKNSSGRYDMARTFLTSHLTMEAACSLETSANTDHYRTAQAREIRINTKKILKLMSLL
jgi:hypothetical protein